MHLLDTHTVLWFLDGDARLSARARELIEHRTRRILVSVVSVWEIAIKVNVGKLMAPGNLLEELARERLEVLDVTAEHAWRVVSLPRIDHRDPFDRLIAAQALVEGLPVISRDPEFDAYGVTRVW